MSTIAKFLPVPPNGFSTQIASATVAADALSVALDSATGLPTEGVGQFFKKDASGNLVAGSVEFVHWTNVSGNTITFSDVNDRGITGSDSGAQAYVADDYFEVWVTSYYVGGYGGLTGHNADGTHITSLPLTTPKITTSINDANGNEVIKTPATASAVNEITVTNAQTGNRVYLAATGGDTNIDLDIAPKGTGNFYVTNIVPRGQHLGWIDSNDTWTYASASTFTIAGVDRTGYYEKGTRLMWVQDATVKYGVVVASAFSTNTTVTIAVNTDYVIANSAITSNRYSHEASPSGYPTWFNYTATYTGFSSDPTSVVSRFSIIGNICTVAHRETTAGTSNATTFTVSAPVTAKTITNMIWMSGIASCTDNTATSTTQDSASIASAGTTFGLSKAANGSGWTNSGGKRAIFQISYEI